MGSPVDAGRAGVRLAPARDDAGAPPGADDDARGVPAAGRGSRVGPGVVLALRRDARRVHRRHRWRRAGTRRRGVDRQGARGHGAPAAGGRAAMARAARAAQRRAACDGPRRPARRADPGRRRHDVAVGADPRPAGGGDRPPAGRDRQSGRRLRRCTDRVPAPRRRVRRSPARRVGAGRADLRGRRGCGGAGTLLGRHRARDHGLPLGCRPGARVGAGDPSRGDPHGAGAVPARAVRRTGRARGRRADRHRDREAAGRERAVVRAGAHAPRDRRGALGGPGPLPHPRRPASRGAAPRRHVPVPRLQPPCRPLRRGPLPGLGRRRCHPGVQPRLPVSQAA